MTLETTRTLDTLGVDLLDTALSTIRSRLPDNWSVEVMSASEAEDVRLVLGWPGNSVGFMVNLVGDLRPRDVERMFGSPLIRQLRAASAYQPVLVVAPSLSPQTRAALRGEGISYLDQVGNVWLYAANAPLLIDVEAVTGRRPVLPQRAQGGLGGAAVGRVVRVLADGRPPATLESIARAAGVSLGYCSRVVKVLGDELLVERSARGGVADADWRALLRRRGEATRLFRPQATTSYVARDGVDAVLARLGDNPPPGQWCVTGSHAAARHAPVTVPQGLTLWALDPDGLAHQLRLLPVNEGGDVRIVRPSDHGPFDRMGGDDGPWWEAPPAAPRGVRWAAPTQVVIDCLGGTGRMPEEGDALLGWLGDHEQQWRARPITDLPAPILEPLT